MNKCRYCGEILAGNFETVHTMDGEIFCSKKCALMHTIIAEGTDTETAKKKYDMMAEEVLTEEVLAEDFTEIIAVAVVVSHRKVPNSVGVACQQLKEYLEDYYVVTMTDEYGRLVDNAEITFAADLVR